VTVSDMYEAVMDNLEWATIVIKAAAVGDYTPVNTFEGKISKRAKKLVLELVRTTDILLEVGRRKDNKIVVGFAAETENVIENALTKLRVKKLDLIVANDVSKSGAGFEKDTNIVYFVDRWGKVEELPLLTKSEIAERIFDKVIQIKQHFVSLNQ